tara:strand:- start:853 stop:1254 length:402 start_codon:yes stop_codon:yes gene_type:complete
MKKGKNKKGFERLMLTATRVLGEQLDTNMPWHQGVIFLTVATVNQDEGIDMKEMARVTGLSTSSVSRNIQALGEWHRLQRPGLGVVETITDWKDRRRRPVRLSHKGRRVMEEVYKAVWPQLNHLLEEEENETA